MSFAVILLLVEDSKALIVMVGELDLVLSEHQLDDVFLLHVLGELELGARGHIRLNQFDHSIEFLVQIVVGIFSQFDDFIEVRIQGSSVAGNRFDSRWS